MSRFGKGSSKPRRGARSDGRPGHRNGTGNGKNHERQGGGTTGHSSGGSADGHAAGKDDSQRPPLPQNQTKNRTKNQTKKQDKPHGEGHRHHRKGAPMQRHKPFFKPGAGRDNKDYGDAGKRDLPPENIEKSRDSIKKWLSAGAELRVQNSQRSSTPADPKTLSLDPWQQQVFDLLRSGESVIVDAPTTAGKTRAV